MLSGKYKNYYKNALDYIPENRIYTDPLRCLAYGTDASFYRLIPKIIIDATTEEEIAALLHLARKYNLPVTFRAAGTSLSGQAISDSILIRLADGWKKFRISNDVKSIKLQAGIIGSTANRFLAPFGRKIGPDPASIDTCMIGGIISNNASGMCCGVAENSYNTLDSVRIILIDGTILDTGDYKSRADFAKTHNAILEGLTNIRKEILADSDLAERIKRKFKIKNTTGYSLNAFVDCEDPFDILQQLIVGSEGTLAFVSEVTYKTVVEHPCKASALIIFPNIKAAAEATMILKKQPVSAVELMDRPSLKSIEDLDGMPEYLKTLSSEATALLVETRAATAETLTKQIAKIETSLSKSKTEIDFTFTDIPEEYMKLWATRKGLLPSAAGMRATGRTILIEDVCFPIATFADAMIDIQNLFKKHGYPDGVIFGHALEGNVHFTVTQDFNSEAEIKQYYDFMEDIAHMVIDKYDGSMKAEHGTGRNVAPFVEKEWGKTAYKIMHDIKDLFDSKYLLNPGIILNDDPKCHIKNLKPLPAADDLIDKCMECGFCEPICPSKNLTITPRQRIAVWREICRLRDEDTTSKSLKKLLKEFDYFGEATCAADGLCGTRCPVKIDTGKMTKHIRELNSGKAKKIISQMTVKHFGTVTKLMNWGLSVANTAHRVLGADLMLNSSKLARKLACNKIPLWNKEIPTGAQKIKKHNINLGNPTKVVFFPSCVSRSMGASLQEKDKRSLPEVTESVLRKAGYEVIYPENMEKLCCGQPYESKGLIEDADKMSAELSTALLKASENGKYPVLCDTSPCLYRMKSTMDGRIKLYEPIDFILEFLMEKLQFVKKDKSITIHSTCTTKKMGLDAKFKILAEACVNTVVIPEDINCCGFAGDRGFSYPELNAYALRDLRTQVRNCDEGYSTSKTCEIGLSLHSGISYKSILYLVDECSIPKHA